jgi:N-acetylglutamate synthase-like GNAT family acetyltransferase
VEARQPRHRLVARRAEDGRDGGGVARRGLVDRNRHYPVIAIRPCTDEDREAIFAIVNAAAEAYRGVIPADRWHEPYMPLEELDGEIAAGVDFWGYETGGELVGIMGIQPVRDVHLIRHAYVLPDRQRGGAGGALLERLLETTDGPILVGTWAAATWAIDFYRRHGFEQVSPKRRDQLLRAYWSIPARQVDTSVVLERG